MRKATSTQTATTFTVLLGFTAKQREGLTGTYVWPTAEKARETITMMVEVNGFEHTEYAAPGLEVHAFYVNGELATVIVIEDDTAARIHKAIRKAQPVTVSYTSESGRQIVRTVEPYSMITTSAGNVLLKTMDREAADYRSFRLDRISAYTLHRTAFLVKRPTTKKEVRMAKDDGAPVTRPLTTVANYRSAKIIGRTAGLDSAGTLTVFSGVAITATYTGVKVTDDVWALIHADQPGFAVGSTVVYQPDRTGLANLAGQVADVTRVIDHGPDDHRGPRYTYVIAFRDIRPHGKVLTQGANENELI